MLTTKILQEDQSYTYRSYFEMPYEADEILAEFGYLFESRRLQLPMSNQPLEGLSFVLSAATNRRHFTTY